MSNAALIYAAHNYERPNLSRAAVRILRHAKHHKCQCGRKGYRTERKARVALATIQRQEHGRQIVLGQEAPVERSYYLCRKSGLYHLTSKE